MIHKIKALYDDGNGLSQREIARELCISRNTVKKYLAISASQISEYLEVPKRGRQLDEHRDFITGLLSRFSGLSSVKIARKLREAHPELEVSNRTIRRYVADLRKMSCEAQPRYYAPVVDIAPGQQCQIDGGELRGVLINGIETIVYFVVFVLSYSRLMYVAAQFKPVATADFIHMHDVALRYFGGVPKEMVYDQAKLVVLDERYRELTLNNRFAEYATHAGFEIRACEGFDPESKGRVESGVKYVKHNALYGETFTSRDGLLSYLADWLDNTANLRTHGSTGKVPMAHFEAEEQGKLKTYLTPACVVVRSPVETRRADKTGLISWQSNKYSVPLAWQRQTVAVRVDNNELVILSPDGKTELARHTLATGKRQIVRNTDHYRDKTQQIAALEKELEAVLPAPEGHALLQLIRESSPKIYKDQLVGLKSIIKKRGAPDAMQLAELIDRPKLTMRQFEELWQLMQAREKTPPPVDMPIHSGQLAGYAHLTSGGAHV